MSGRAGGSSFVCIGLGTGVFPGTTIAASSLEVADRDVRLFSVSASFVGRGADRAVGGRGVVTGAATSSGGSSPDRATGAGGVVIGMATFGEGNSPLRLLRPMNEENQCREYARSAQHRGQARGPLPGAFVKNSGRRAVGERLGFH